MSRTTSGSDLPFEASSISGGAAGEVVYQDDVSSTSFTNAGTTGQVLTSTGGTTAPSFQTPATPSLATNATNVAGGSQGKMIYQIADSTTRFTNATAGVMYTNGTDPAFTTTIPYSITFSPATVTAPIIALAPATQVYSGIFTNTDVFSTTANGIIFQTANARYTVVGQDSTQNTVITNSAAKDVVISNTGGSATLKAAGGFQTSGTVKVGGLLSATLVATDATGLLIPTTQAFPTVFTLNHALDNPDLVSGNLVPAIAGDLALALSTAPSFADSWFSPQFRLEPGNYILSFWAWKGSNRGIVTWYLNGVAQATQSDFYNAGDTTQLQQVAVIITSSALTTLTGTVTGKNASSTGYFAPYGDYSLTLL